MREWAKQKLEKCSMDKKEKQKINNRISAQNHRVKEKKKEQQLVEDITKLYSDIWVYVKALLEVLQNCQAEQNSIISDLFKD